MRLGLRISGVIWAFFNTGLQNEFWNRFEAHPIHRTRLSCFMCGNFLGAFESWTRLLIVLENLWWCICVLQMLMRPCKSARIVWTWNPRNESADTRQRSCIRLIVDSVNVTQRSLRAFYASDHLNPITLKIAIRISLRVCRLRNGEISSRGYENCRFGVRYGIRIRVVCCYEPIYVFCPISRGPWWFFSLKLTAE